MIVNGHFACRRSIVIRLCLLVATFQTVVGQSLTGVSLPCQEAGRDPDEDNPMDNLSCPADGIDCFTASQLCDCVNATQNGSMSASSIFDSASFGIRSLNCMTGTFQCSGEEEYLPLSALCNGTNECTSGHDETNTFCANRCLLPYYGGCPYNRECISVGNGIRCGDCLPGFRDGSPWNAGCKVNVVFTQMDYYGNAADGYAQDICVEIYPDPVGFVNGWEGFFISSGKTTISTAVDILTQSRDFVDSFEVNLNATELEYCFNIYSSIVNLLDGESDAYFSLHQPDSLDSYLYISYNALANVTLVPASYQVREDGKAVDVCANVAPNLFCDSLYDFQVYLSISTGSSGSDNHTYFTTLNFTHCEPLSCTSVPIFDDNVPEYEEESYILSLVRPPGLDSWVGLSSETRVITVIDDDDILVGFNPMEYTTTEAEGQVSVCVGVVNTNGTRETFSVALLPDEEFETANTADDCYKVLEFSAGELRKCHNYSISDDQQCELETLETQFKVRVSLLASNDTKLRVDLALSTATIVIDDSKEPECFVRVGFEETSLTVSEHQESVEVCVNSTSPGIEEEFVMNITTDNTSFFQSRQQLEFVANSSSLSDRQCYNQSYDLTSVNICSYFPDCSDVQVILTLAKSNTSDYVSVIEDRSALEMTVEVPERCSCSTKPPPSALSDAAIAAVVLAVLVALALLATVVLVAVFCCREKNKKAGWEVPSRNEHHYFYLGKDRQTTLLKHLRNELENKKMIYSKDQLELSKAVGQGESGLVYKAYIKTSVGKEIVAVKTGKALFSTGDLERLAKEVSTMLSFKHENVMSLIGVCIDGEMPLLIMPFMSNGNVLDFVRNNKESLFCVGECLTDKIKAASKILLKMSHHISKGMEYLSRHKFVHRDLAARNCMIDGDGVIKVADFGLTEDMYGTNYYRREKSETGCEEKVPIRWMAPESIEYNIYTQATDVVTQDLFAKVSVLSVFEHHVQWSFGVTMWEIFSCGAIPYGGIHAMCLLKELQRGQRLEKPNNVACSDDIYEVMLSCWELEASERPKFSDLVDSVDGLLERDSGYLQLSPPSQPLTQ